jgi:dipeptidase E
MKLYLSSYRIPTPEDLINLTGKKPSKVRVAIIMNAKDYLIERARNIKVSSTEEYLQKLGYINYHEIDLRKYKDIKLSNEDLKSFDMLFIAGGNTFCLMEELVNSGLNKIIKNLIDDGIVYVGG